MGYIFMGVKEALKWFDDHHRSKGFRYSMTDRYGGYGYDCSSSVYYALIAGGVLPKGSYIGNTETLFKLKGTYFDEIYSYKDVRAGDIFIRGGEGTSAGAGGHTGMFYKKDGIVHSNYTNDGISYNDINTIDYYLDRQRSWNERYFRPRYPESYTHNVDNSVTLFAKEVINGKYGNGNARKENIYKTVQDEVNNVLNKKQLKNNYVTEIAKKVIQGKYGNGENRKNNIYNEIQDKVNRIL